MQIRVAKTRPVTESRRENKNPTRRTEAPCYVLEVFRCTVYSTITSPNKRRRNHPHGRRVERNDSPVQRSIQNGEKSTGTTGGRQKIVRAFLALTEKHTRPKKSSPQESFRSTLFWDCNWPKIPACHLRGAPNSHTRVSVNHDSPFKEFFSRS